MAVSRGWRRSVAHVAVTLVAMPLAALATSAPAEAAATGKVMATTERMSDATLSSTQHGTYAAGTTLSLVCYKRGQAVSGYYGGPNDLWYKVSDGYFAADVDLYTGTSNPITPACPTTVTIDQNRWYAVRNVNSGKVVDVRNASASDGAAVQQYGANGSSAQYFRFIATDSGYYRVVSALSGGRVWDIKDKATGNGAKIHTWTWVSGTNQQWKPVSAGSSVVSFRPRNATGRCLDVPNASKSDAVQLQIYDCNSTNAQKWSLVTGPPVSGPYVTRAVDLRFCVNTGLKACGTSVPIYKDSANSSVLSKVGSFPAFSRVSVACVRTGSSWTGAWTSDKWYYLTGSGKAGYVHSSLVSRVGAVAQCTGNKHVMALEHGVRRAWQTSVATGDRKYIPVGGWDYRWAGWCPQLPRLAYALQGISVKAGNAIDNYRAYKAEGKINTSTPPPPGAIVYYDQQWSQYGHTNLSLGGGWVVSTMGSGGSGKANAIARYDNPTFARYLGWHRPA